MLGGAVTSDLECNNYADCLKFKTAWGKKAFIEGFESFATTSAEIKHRQLPLLGLNNQTETCQSIQSILESINVNILDDIDNASGDVRIDESVGQILWKRDSMGSFLNTNQTVLKGLLTWKTIILPGFALLMPILALIVPFFVLRFMNPSMETSDYLERVRSVLLQQISVPSVITKWKVGSGERIGFVLESLFIGLTLAMFISSLWNQITTALHYRSIWNDLEYRGGAIHSMVANSKRILDILRELPLKRQKALRRVIEEGETAIDSCKTILHAGHVPSYGALWNTPSLCKQLKDWIARVDIYVAIAMTPRICFPKLTDNIGISLKGVYHPCVEGCVSNNYDSYQMQHTILTGPNRGGKSTFCKAVGLAVLTAQSWGFAFAKSMELCPFTHFYTALEPSAKLGECSTFESEIEFAKRVLAAAEPTAQMFVMMDEIFHSTNASDGVSASRIFLNQLYERSRVVSIISTHYRELAESYISAAQSLQMESEPMASGKLHYTYKVSQGVSTQSSVMEILIERGLASAAAAVEPIN